MLTVCSFLKCDVSFFTLCAKMSLWEFLSWDGELKLPVTTVLTVTFMKEVCVTTHITTFKPATARKSLSVAYSLERNPQDVKYWVRITGNKLIPD